MYNPFVANGNISCFFINPITWTFLSFSQSNQLILAHLLNGFINGFGCQFQISRILLGTFLTNGFLHYDIYVNVSHISFTSSIHSGSNQMNESEVSQSVSQSVSPKAVLTGLKIENICLCAPKTLNQTKSEKND